MPTRHGKRRKQRPAPQVEAVRTGAAAMARGTAGRARVFADRRKAALAARDAIRKALEEQEEQAGDAHAGRE